MQQTILRTKQEIQDALSKVDDYFNEDVLYVDEVTDDYISIQPTSQYTFYDHADWDRIIKIVQYLFTKTTQQKVWIGNYLYDRNETKFLKIV